MISKNKPPLTVSRWEFPGVPGGPEWKIDWIFLEQVFPWLRELEKCPQDSLYHAEGDVLTHTRMVCEWLCRHSKWQALDSTSRSILFAAALLHDVTKPLHTVTEPDGRISSAGHSKSGSIYSFRLLWGVDAPEMLVAPLEVRRHVSALIRYHSLPLYFWDKPMPEKTIITASMSLRNDYLSLLAQADIMGRICQDQTELIDRIIFFEQTCKNLECFMQPRQFSSDHSRFLYFKKDGLAPELEVYDDTCFNVILLSGIPGAGKDTWIKKHGMGLPVISLDQIREKMKIGPDKNQGVVVNQAKEEARILLRKQQSFIWNATNISRQLRKQLVDLFYAYKARTKIVYIDASWAELIERNNTRKAPVPDSVLQKLSKKLEIPNLTEAHQIIIHQNDDRF